MTSNTKQDIACDKNKKQAFCKISCNSDIVQTTPENQWRPYPWCLWPDFVSIGMGIIVLIFLSPPMAVLIGLTNMTMFALQWSWANIFSKTPITKDIPSLIYDKFAKWAGNIVLKDIRNSEFIPSFIFLCTFCPALLGYAAYRHYHYGFELWMFFIYHFLRLGPRFRFFTHAHVLFHKEGHDYNGFFKDDSVFSIFNHWLIQWFVGLFYGQIAYSYSVGHNKIHHKYDNGLDDVHTNIDIDRTDSWSFIMYIPRFGAYWLGITPFGHFLAHKEYRYAWLIAKGMIFYYGVFYLLYQAFGLTFALCYFIFPQLEAITFFSAISYMWHLWISPEDPTNPYINSVTIVKGHDNVWGEDYHAIHHHAVSVHWRDADNHYDDHEKEYQENMATIFTDCEEGVLLYWVFSGNWDEIAAHFIDLNGKLSHEEKKDLLMRRAKCTFGKKTQYGWKHLFQTILGTNQVETKKEN
ncbi:hypothetical protein ABK040_016710 [Willaertia magna]